MKRLVYLVLLTGLLAVPVWAETTLPEGPGLAARYPGDIGIAADPAVILADGFESGGKIIWDSQGDGTPTTDEKARVHRGRYSLRIDAPPGESSGGGMTKLFRPGYDQVCVRWYVMYAEDYDEGFGHHDGGCLAALANRWYLGRSGNKPVGNDYFQTWLQTSGFSGRRPPGQLFFYTYYADMKRDPDGNFWGNTLQPKTDFAIERGRWYCWEMMVKMGTPDKPDGEQAFWVDGKLLGHFTGLRMRLVDALKLNAFMLGLYVHDNQQRNRLWYDDVVIATSYIGPMTSASEEKPQ